MTLPEWQLPDALEALASASDALDELGDVEKNVIVVISSPEQVHVISSRFNRCEALGCLLTAQHIVYNADDEDDE